MSIDPAYLNAYIDRLKAHDWFYERSDDPRAFKAGQAAKQSLLREANMDPSCVLHQLYNAMAICASRTNGAQAIDCRVTFDEYVALVLKRANATARPDPTHRLAACVRSLANALAQAAPDNSAPSRAMKLLQDLGLLESTLMPNKQEKSDEPDFDRARPR